MGFALSFPEETGGTKEVLRQGFGFDFHTAYTKPDSVFGIRFDASHASFSLSDTVLKHVDGADSGYMVAWGGGASLQIQPKHSKRIKPTIYAGPGLYYERAEATRDGVTTGIICDPWFGCYEALVPGQVGVAKISTTRMGWQGGADIDFTFDGGGAFSIGVQYVRINNTNVDTEYIPINVGYTQRF
jgi:opacity protein-like surface antigen